MKVDTSSEGGQRLFNVVLDPGQEVTEVLADLARQEDLQVASMIAIGGFQEVRLGFYNLTTKGFDEIPLDLGQVEVLSLSGEITWPDGAPYVHGHAVVGSRDGTTHGGHLLRGVVQPILIVTLEELPQASAAHHA